jgi:hypothetical protein
MGQGNPERSLLQPDPASGCSAKAGSRLHWEKRRRTRELWLQHLIVVPADRSEIAIVDHLSACRTAIDLAPLRLLTIQRFNRLPHRYSGEIFLDGRLFAPSHARG